MNWPAIVFFCNVSGTLCSLVVISGFYSTTIRTVGSLVTLNVIACKWVGFFSLVICCIYKPRKIYVLVSKMAISNLMVHIYYFYIYADSTREKSL